MASLFAATYPERTRALVLYGTYAKRRDPTTTIRGRRRRRSGSRYAEDLERTGATRSTSASMAPNADDGACGAGGRAAARRAEPRRRARPDPDEQRRSTCAHVLPTVQAPTLVMHRTRRPRRERRGRPLHRRADSRARGSSSFRATTTCRGSTRTRSSTRSRSSSPACARAPEPSACSRRSSSPTSSARRSARVELGDRALGGAARARTTRSCARELARFRGAGDRHRRRRLLRHFRRSGPRDSLRAAPSATPCESSGSRCVPACTPARCERPATSAARHRGAHRRTRRGASPAPARCSSSSTTRDLVAGSGLVFEDRGERELKGVDEPRRLYAAT